MQYPINSSLKKGLKICFGSDWSVSTYNPFKAMEISVTHKHWNDNKYGVFIKNEIIGIEDAILAYTRGGATALGINHKIGSLEVGKQADLIIIDQNLFNIEENKIHKTKVLLTIIKGSIGWQNDDFENSLNI